MSSRSTFVKLAIQEYINSISLREPEILVKLREETKGIPHGNMQICPEQGQFMGLMAKMIGARKALEVGVFTGYSALSVALALPQDGKLVACDISEEWTSIARKYWQEAGVAERVELHLAPAIETLNALIAGGESATFDLAFIDADKCNYPTYIDLSLRLLRTGGLLMLDNVLWGGSVLSPPDDDPEAKVLAQVNLSLANDSRVDISLLPIGDGLMLARKR